MIASELPNRRVEAWKYSDLRAALDGAARGKRLERTPERERLAALAHESGDVIGALAVDHGLAESLNVVGVNEQFIQWESEDFAPRFEVVRLAPRAQLTRVIVQRGEGVNLLSTRVHMAAGASFRQFVIAEGAKLARIETHVSIEGERAEVELNGIYMVADGRHADLTSIVSHNVPGATTRQLIKGAARAGGRGVFQGKILVAHGAQKTDARQHHAALMLEEGAEIDAKPELEIYADDVQCAHGNAIGALDDAQLFYARARGIPETEARALLVEAFLAEAVPEHLPDDVRAEILGRIAGWLR